jgi:hypothetical protein
MTQSLREEIEKHFKKEWGREWAFTPNEIDYIIKLIEKRIDSIEPLDDIEYLAGHVGFEDAKNKMKELLK